MSDVQVLHALDLEVVTPEGVALALKADELTLPTAGGAVGVLPGHRALVAALETGILQYLVGADQHRVAVGGGYVEVSADKVVAITQRFARPSDVDAARARADLEAAAAELDGWSEPIAAPAYADLVLDEAWAAARLELVGEAVPPAHRLLAGLELAHAADYLDGLEVSEPPAAPAAS